ncbi:alpha/beta fold hydrolase [Amycolatopsis carbonis]|uniref:Alpha/beta fold hydrolase n=1 Tax=Amycolatopsis carbonis TaxID=715471 RepID=A0A9Y2IPV4_9PSEU|nr:alpha/beta fold hydrolase [Amycolatopsis sp. 2-15]WIX82971.1 alpha/beta fold hydrolase [Amycolatopsis sp. 2-15]
MNSVRRVGIVVAAALAAVAVVGSPASAAPAESCAEVEIPVTADLAVAAQVHGTYCTPVGRQPRTVQLLVHGATYDRRYWNEAFDVPAAAAADGYATLAIDKLGYGESTHLPSVLITAETESAAVHQVITALRGGAVGGHAYDRVALVGHSLGSIEAMAEAGTYHDVDYLVLTGMTHYLSLDILARTFTQHLYPAVLDAQVGPVAGLDAGMLTSIPGHRGALFDGDTASAAAVARDEATKDVLSATEADGAVQALSVLPLTNSFSITVPVLIENGAADVLFCGGVLGISCATADSIDHAERGFFPRAPRFTAIAVPGAAHSLTLSPSAAEATSDIDGWLTRQSA